MNVTRYAKRIEPMVATALQIGDDEERRQALETLAENAFAVAYDDRVRGDSSDDLTSDDIAAYTAGLGALDFTTDDSSPERVADWIARSADNYAAVKAAPENSVLTWRTQRDDNVRDIHAAADGQQRKPGDAFDIAGQPLMYPGQPIGTPEHWANCRCRLLTDRGLAAGAEEEDDELIARAFDADKRKAMADKGTAMPDGSYPIANVEDLRNAIQAIGRAKDPAAVKRHIRKRAKALNAEYLIPDSWTASAAETDSIVSASLTAWAPSSSPPGTHDAPGWLTNPRETQRLRTYWTKGEGAGKIGWGSPGDLTRCAKHLAKYVLPNYVWGTCQNLHYEALGYWNPESNRQASVDPTFDEINAAITAAFTAAKETPMEMLAPPTEWFDDPALTKATPLTVTADGRVFGHLAAWETCHVGITGECVTPPRSNTAYAHFRTGEVETADGSLVAVGQITMDTGHAGKHDGPAATVSHYDNTGTGVADVVVGEDNFGIWIAGAMRPGVSEQQMYVLKATGALSGDWRRIGGNLELVAALAVNVPGFPIPRLEMAASAAGTPLSLVAAAIVGVDPNAVDADRVAIAVLARLDQREAEAKRRERAAALTATITGLRVEALSAAVR